MARPPPQTPGAKPLVDPLLGDERFELIGSGGLKQVVTLQQIADFIGGGGGVVTTVPNGGTGLATLTLNGVLYGNGINPVGVTAAGVTGQFLGANTGAGPTWQTPPSGLLAALVYNALTFAGVDPTGVADSTVGLQAAITAAAGATLYIPAGTYKVSLQASGYALVIAASLNVIVAPGAIIKLATTVALPAGKGLGYSTVCAVLVIQASNVTIRGGGTFDWNTTNATFPASVSTAAFCALIYVTTGVPAISGPYYTDVHIDGIRIRNSRVCGIWTEDTSRLWVTNTNHAGGNGTDIIFLRSLISPVDVHIDNNYVDSSTIPVVGQSNNPPIQLSINFTGSPGQTTNRWSMNYNVVEAGLNTNVYYTATQIYSPFNPDGLNGAWRRGEAIGNWISGAIGGGGPLGGAEAISAVMVVDSTINFNVIQACYIAIELAGFNCSCLGNVMDGLGLYMAVGIFMDGGGFNNAIGSNVIRGFGGWSTFTAISSRSANTTYSDNAIINEIGSGATGTGITVYVDSQNATLGNDNSTIVGNKIFLAGASLGVDVWDTSNLNVTGNTIFIENGAGFAVRLQAPGTVSHLPRDHLKVKNNTLVGAPVTLLASADWGTNIDLEGLPNAAVTQGTSKSTAIATTAAFQIDITMNNAALASLATVAFSWPNIFVAATDTVVVQHQSGGTIGAYKFNAACGAGATSISVTNISGGSLSEAIVLRCVLTKSKST